MALLSFLPSTDPTATLHLSQHPHAHHHHHHHHHNNKPNSTKNTNKTKKKKKTLPPPPPPPKPSFSWEHFKNLLSCKNTLPPSAAAAAKTKYARLSSKCGSSICAIRDVVHGNTRVIHRPDSSSDRSSSSDSGSHNDSTPLSSSAAASRSLRSTAATAPRSGGRQLMKLSGCYECHAVDAQSAFRRYPRPRTLCPCTECGEVFTKLESLELHQAIRHAVSELGPDDSGRHIVEIIFKSSWTFQKHVDSPPDPTTGFVSIGRILKIHNTQRTIARFEDYRDSVKSNSLLGPHHRSAADGNELLRFHSSSLACSLGSDGSTSLCLGANTSSPSPIPCSVCTIIRYGFARAHHGPVETTASSARAHECRGGGPGETWRAMLVCRVIAGRIGRKGVDADVEGVSGSYDSMAGDADGNLEELLVENPRAILPCFVVIYRALA